MISKEDARALAEQWVDAWNRHDLDAVLDHYADDVVFDSPLIQRIIDEPSGTLRGTGALREYFRRGLSTYPDLTFRLRDVLCGVSSVTLYYESVNGMMASEMMILNAVGRIVRVSAHYR